MPEHHVRIVVADFGEIDRVDLEDRVHELVQSVPGGDYDGTGTDLQTGEFEVFIYGPSADALVEVLVPYLREVVAEGARMKLLVRQGGVELDLVQVDLG